MVWLSAVFSEALNDGRAKDIDQIHGIFPLDGEGHQELRPRRFAEAALEFERYAGAIEGADALVCLGDLVLFLDYADHSRGIFPELFGVENADRIVELRTARRFDEARELGRALWGGIDRDSAIESAVRKLLSVTR